jgi:2-polyprenyl-6-methoxyphenol hydroxylase-like FAD-dependent oxidoreductase
MVTKLVCGVQMKCTIHSEHGSIMVIPREANMVRLYIQIASSTDGDWNPRKTATESDVQASAKKILQPYAIEWESVAWYSVYPIGQGIADHYTLDHRVFLGGDACHTHSVSCPLRCQHHTRFL